MKINIMKEKEREAYLKQERADAKCLFPSDQTKYTIPVDEKVDLKTVHVKYFKESATFRAGGRMVEFRVCAPFFLDQTFLNLHSKHVVPQPASVQEERKSNKEEAKNDNLMLQATTDATI